MITSAVYVLVWIGLCALKWLVPQGWGSLGFDALFCAISVLGSLELLRAFSGCGNKISFRQKSITVAFCSASVPLYVVLELTMGQGFLGLGCLGCLYAFVLAALNVFDHGESTVAGTCICFFTMLYCGILSCMLSAVNHVAENSVAAVITLFFSVVLTDSGAYVFGSALKRYVPCKLAPKLSPNKTVIGALGGLIGGMIGGVLAYCLYYFLGGVIGTEFVYGGSVDPWVLFILIGLITSVFTQCGDLFESAIKRECGIKDMGRLLPGHGGVLDRFDSMLFSGVIVLFLFGVVIV